MGKFVVREVATGVKFDLHAANGQVILSSEVYSSRKSALKGIGSIRRAAPRAHLEDRTGETQQTCAHPKFVIYLDKSGAYRFRLKARNGEIIGTSEGYTAKSGCLNGIESVRKNAETAQIEE